MTPYEIATAKGASVYVFDYAHCDLAQTFTFGAGDWGSYQADGTVSVGTILSPLLDSNSNSQAGAITISIPLSHLPVFTEAHINWAQADSSALTVTYTLDGGTTWHSLAEDGRVALSAGNDFDIKIAFTGGIASDPSQLITLNVYVFKSDTMWSEDRGLPVTFTTATFPAEGMALTGTLTVNLNQQIPPPYTPPPGAPVPAPYTTHIGTIEFWARVDSGTGTFVTSSVGSIGTASNSGTVYIDGVLNGTATLTDGQFHYFALVGDLGPTATASIGGVGLTISHLAAYRSQLTSADIVNNYNGEATLIVNDTATITVTESSPAADIYAYAWQIVSGNS